MKALTPQTNKVITGTNIVYCRHWWLFTYRTTKQFKTRKVFLAYKSINQF
jgi:hypothetical protein